VLALAGEAARDDLHDLVQAMLKTMRQDGKLFAMST
jgi:hypothetical protein